MSTCAMVCVRGPSSSTGRILVRGSMASQSTCVVQRSRVRSSSKQQVREVQMAEEALVQGVRVLPSSGQPGGDGTLSKAEDSPSLGRVLPFGQREIRTIAT
jgi:hypothetical protein